MVLQSLFEPGLWSSQPVHVAMLLGGGAAIVSAVVGIFTIIRGNTFAGHALSDISGVGGSASFLLGLNPLAGFAIMGILGAMGIELASSRKSTDRSMATGIALGAGLSLSALFLYLNSEINSTTGVTFTVMFGSMWSVNPSMIPWICATGLIALCLMLLLYRPLMLSCVDVNLAHIRGINVPVINLVYLVVLALSTALSALTIGAILSTALLIGPASAALHLCKRPGWAIVIACLIGIFCTFAGVILAYDSFYWTPGHGWPVSFFVVVLIFLCYLMAVSLPTLYRTLRACLPRRFMPNRYES